MKKLLLLLLVSCSLFAKAQVYNNEWIDYTKTYYKFKVGKTGLYRIPQPVLAAAGLGNTTGQDFQLWRNGAQVPIYTSSSGFLSATDYIEFWGEMNDGKPDKALYREPDYQLNDKWSLETDTATYFLTTNTTGNNLRLTNTPNNITGNMLPAEPYFMYTAGNYFKNKINPGYAVNVGEYMYSSSYDRGEGYTSADIATGAANSATFSNLFVFAAGPNATFTIAVSGNAVNPRNYKVTINNDSVTGGPVDFFTYVRSSATVPVSLIASNSAAIKVSNQCELPNDRMVVHQYELTYPRQFNFGNTTNFEFTLPASAAGNYLEIKNFNAGTTLPVLYDLTNGQRYIVNNATAGTLKVVLQPSATSRKLVLVSQATANINMVANMQPRQFINFGAEENQGDYLIVSNPILNGNAASPVEEYRTYRSSVAGGGYNAKVYWIDDIVDQFGFGIKKNPLALRNFLLFARHRFAAQPKYVFLIGRAVNYSHQRSNESKADMESLNLVPTYGWPASDVLLTAEPGSSVPQIPIGRLSAINAQEVAIYLTKVKDYEAVQRAAASGLEDKAWMKNVVHVVGSNDPSLQGILDSYMNSYKKIISDTLFGGKVYTFSQTSTDAVQQLRSSELKNLFNNGVSLITYFGHSSSSTLAFNLDHPDNYDNYKKYPVFIALGCDAGDFYGYNSLRNQVKATISEQFVLAQDRGSIAFVASSYLGIVHYLDVLNSRLYKAAATTEYGRPLGHIIQSAISNMLNFTTEEDFYARATVEEMGLNGDPAIHLNAFGQPDYTATEADIKITPAIISVADDDFTVKAKFMNLGKAVNQHIVVQVSRQYPDLSSEIVYTDTIPGIRYADSVSVDIPVKGLAEKGLNKITVMIDANDQVGESDENNNSITKEFYIYEEEARPVYPYNYAIVNKQHIKLAASTANAFIDAKQYVLEIDTTGLFNSAIKVSKSLTSKGGLLEFDPGIIFKDSTVYYWRVAVVSNGQPLWNEVASFVYLSNHAAGMNQSHKYQQLKSSYTDMYMDSASGQLYYTPVANDILIRNAVFPISGNMDPDFQIFINSTASYIGGGCTYNELIFNVLDSVTLKPWRNTYTTAGGLYNSLKATCGSRREYNFEYPLNTVAGRKNAMDFLNRIPAGSFVIVRSNTHQSMASNTYASVWAADTALYGSGHSLYHMLYQQGFADADSFNRPRAFTFIFKKDGHEAFTPQSQFSRGIYDKITLNLEVNTSGYGGIVQSPTFGPAKSWKEFSWSGYSVDNGDADVAETAIIGIKPDGTKDIVLEHITPDQKQVDISLVNAEQYPYLQLQMSNRDSLYHTPYQLNYWRLSYDPEPEGALAPNLYLKAKDTLDVGEDFRFEVPFKNVSDIPFDSTLKVKVVITDKNNTTTVLQESMLRPLAAGDTLLISQPIDTKKYPGNNSLYIVANPEEDEKHRPEQYFFNNFGYKNFYVREDTLHPLLDVTFDNAHILNHDIVSSKPDIVIKLKDESKWLLLDDTSLATVQVRYPNGSVQSFRFDNDTLQFIPATKGGTDNVATIRFKPYFAEDGDYELMVSGKDQRNNQAGSVEYRVAFQVINKAMISNMLNYPNPFTTSTAFVFTITGSEVPQNIKIQILTVTGKIVREITKEELGPLRIGRNITEYKWDGTDQYGQKVANGVYLYRVTTNLNGKSLDKYQSDSDNTDKYFNKGYGKMYLMR